MAENITAENWDFPAFKLGELLGVKGSGMDPCSEPSSCSHIQSEGEFEVVVGLIVEVVDGSTVCYVPVDTVASVRSRLGRDESKKVPNVTDALKVPLKNYTDIQEPAQWQIKHVLLHGAYPDAQKVRLSEICTPKVDLEDALRRSAHPEPASDAGNYASERLDVGGQPLGVAAAALLSDLVLGRVLLIQLQGRDSSNSLLARLFLPAVCDAEVEGRSMANQLYWRLARNQTFILKIRNKGCCKPSCIVSTWEKFSAVMQTKPSKNILKYFQSCNFDDDSWPPTKVLTDVGDVMVSRGLAWMDVSSNSDRRNRHKRLLDLEAGAKWRNFGVWGFPYSLQTVLQVYWVDYCRALKSKYPALLLSQLLQCQAKGTGTFFAALVARIDNADTVQLVPVLSDDQAERYTSRVMEGKNFLTVREVVSKSTKSIIDCPLPPKVQLASWAWERSGSFRSMYAESIEAHLYGIGTPEASQKTMQQPRDREDEASLENCLYGSEHLDKDGQPLGVAAVRALSELLLGRVVVVQELTRDCHQRIVARIYVPAVADCLLDGKRDCVKYYHSWHDQLTKIVNIRYLPTPGGARGLQLLVRKLCNLGLVDDCLQTTLLDAMLTKQMEIGPRIVAECLRASVLDGVRPERIETVACLLDASSEMLRRGLAVLDDGEDALYAGRGQELRNMAYLAKVEKQGLWGLPAVL